MLRQAYAKQRRQEISTTRKVATGERGLIASVIGFATSDYFGNDRRQRASAIRYFRSPAYQHHLSILGLPDCWLPEGVSLNGR